MRISGLFHLQSSIFHPRFAAIAAAILAIAASPAARAYEWQNDGILDSSMADRAFASGPGWFSAGPAWLMNSMPGANLRARNYVIDRSGDREASSINYATDVGTLANPFNVMSPNNVDGETDWKNVGTTWSTAANWTAVSGSAPPAPGDVAWFTTIVGTNPSLASISANIAGLYFSTTASSGYTFTRSTGSFTLTGSATSIGTEISNATAVAIGANNTSGTNTISAVPILLAPASGTTSTFFQAAGGTLVLTSGVISGTGISLNLTGGGTFSFAQATANPNTYTGGTKIAGPTVINAGTGAIFGTGTLELNSGTYESSSSTTRSLSNVVSITGDFTFDSLSTGINEFSGSGSTTGDRLITVNTVTTRFVTNPFTLGGNLTTAGTGRLNFQAGLNLGGADRTITAGATGAGGNQINGAIDSSAAGNKLTLAGNNFTLSGVTPGATNVVNFDVNATGTITFTGTNTFLGSVTVDAGTLNAISDSALGSSTAATAGLFMDPSAGTATVNFTSSTPAIASLSSSGAGISSVVLGGSTTPTTLTVGGNNASTTFAGSISDKVLSNPGAIGNLTKTGNGTLTFTNNNSYTGATLVSGGTLELKNSSGVALSGTSGVTVNTGGTLLFSADNQINQATLPGITVGGGKLDAGGVSQGTGGTPAVPNSGTVGLGALTMTSSSVIDLTGTSVLHFADSSGKTWTGTLSIWDWSGTPTTGGGAEQILFGGTATGLTAGQLLQVSFYSDGGTNLISNTAFILPDGEIVPGAPIPEPSTWIGAALALGAIGFTQRKRFAKRSRVIG